MKSKYYLLIMDLRTNKQFFKYFETEYEMDKFKRRIKYSDKLMIIEDSRELNLNYDIAYQYNCYNSYVLST